MLEQLSCHLNIAATNRGRQHAMMTSVLEVGERAVAGKRVAYELMITAQREGREFAGRDF